jgi:hypothetical protein
LVPTLAVLAGRLPSNISARKTSSEATAAIEIRPRSV